MEQKMLAYKQSNERNETNLLAPLTLLLFYFFCFNLLSFFFFLSIGFIGKNNVVDSHFFFQGSSPLKSQDLIINSLYYLSYMSYNVNLENLNSLTDILLYSYA